MEPLTTQPIQLDALLQQEETLSNEAALQVVMALCDTLATQKEPLGWLSSTALLLLSDGSISLVPPTEKATLTEFTAPECYDGSAPTVQSDLYAVGVLLNLLLTGLTPAEHPAQGSLWSIIERCTAVDPNERYASVEELRNALNSCDCSAPQNPQKAESRAESAPDTPKPKPKPKLHRKTYNIVGFRSGTWWKRIVALWGYALILRTACGLTVEGATPKVQLLNRIVFAITALEIVLFTFNFKDIHRELSLHKLKSPALKAIGIAAVDVVILLANMVILLLVLEPLV